MSTISETARWGATAVVLLLAVIAAVALEPAMLRQAAGVETSSEGIGPALKIIKALQTPVLVIGFSLAALAAAGAGIALLIGNRQAMRMLGSLAAGLALLASAVPIAN